MARGEIYKLKQWQTIAEQSAYKAGTMAKSLGISQRQLERWTKRLFKQSPHAWLQEQRFLKAAHELKTHRSVKLVSANLGFKQVSHFSRGFKHHNGVSPSAFLIWSSCQDEKTTTATGPNHRIIHPPTKAEPNVAFG